MTKKICVVCSAEFELLPKKPGLATHCPACSPARTLSPKEAKEASLFRQYEIADGHFREAIKEKRQAEALEHRIRAAELEKEIVAIGKTRTKP